MAKNIPSNDDQRPATKTTLPSKALNQDRSPNREFPRQKKSKRIYLYQTSSARDAKGAAVRKGRKREKEGRTRYKESVMNNYLSIITLNVNGLNAPMKRHRIAEWIRKHNPHICCLQETHLRTKDLHRLKVKSWKQIFQANGQEKKAGVAILIHIRQNRLPKKGHKERPRRSLHNTQRKNPPRRHKHCKYICTQHRSTKYIKKILEDFKKDIDSNAI